MGEERPILFGTGRLVVVSHEQLALVLSISAQSEDKGS